MNRRANAWWVAAVLLLAPLQLLAQSGSSVTAYSNPGINFGPPMTHPSGTDTATGLGTASISFSESQSASPFGVDASISSAVAARATPGLLQAYAFSQSSVSQANMLGQVSAGDRNHARAEWYDHFSVTSAGPLSFDAITIHGSLLLSGTLSATTNGGSADFALAAMRIDGTGLPNPGPNSFSTSDIGCTSWWCAATGAGVGAGVSATSPLPSVIPVAIHAFLNTSTLLSFSLDVMAQQFSSSASGLPLGTFASSSAGADFYSSLAWGGITSITLDSTGAALSGFNVLSDSGYAYYTAPTAPIPEPETYALMLAGLGLLALAQRRRNRPAAA